ncbi:MAG TPA: hypothetical protein VEG65_05790 [Candidatus Bathyarchaeia archaeon]|nr:hypothetical protein [Candidatus Bathyarchaeia archaeon]
MSNLGTAVWRSEAVWRHDRFFARWRREARADYWLSLCPMHRYFVPIRITGRYLEKNMRSGIIQDLTAQALDRVSAVF